MKTYEQIREGIEKKHDRIHGAVGALMAIGIFWGAAISLHAANKVKEPETPQVYEQLRVAEIEMSGLQWVLETANYEIPKIEEITGIRYDELPQVQAKLAELQASKQARIDSLAACEDVTSYISHRDTAKRKWFSIFAGTYMGIGLLTCAATLRLIELNGRKKKRDLDDLEARMGGENESG